MLKRVQRNACASSSGAERQIFTLSAQGFDPATFRLLAHTGVAYQEAD